MLARLLGGLGAVCFGFLLSSTVFGITITTTLDANLPPANPAYVGSSTTQTGRLLRNAIKSTCDGQKPNPGLASTAGSRRVEGYLFRASVSGCYRITLTGPDTLMTAVYSPPFIPAQPQTNYLADPGLSSFLRITYFVNLNAGDQFMVTVSENEPGSGVGSIYTLSVDPVTPQSVTTTLDTTPAQSAPAYETATGLQTGRLVRDGTPSTCRAADSSPGVQDTTPGRRYDSFVFTASRTGCVTVTLSGPGTLFSAAYDSVGHSPGAPQNGYLADAGSSSASPQYSFNVNAGDRFLVVVHEVNPGNATGAAYTLRVSESYRTPFDFDGDMRTDVGIVRPANPAEWWIRRSTNASTFALQFGNPTDKAVPADYTGDAKTDIAFWRPSTGQWFVLRSEDFSFFALPFGSNGDIPAPADYDADGKADFALFRPASGNWFVSQSFGGPTRIFQFGVNGDRPVMGDYDGDGRADAAIYRPGPREWWINRSTEGSLALQFGATGDKVMQGDYTGDGSTDIALWRPSSGEWFVIRSENFSFFGFPFGANGDVPVAADYDGDGRFDASVFRPSQSTFFLSSSIGNPTQFIGFGSAGDVPVASVFTP